MNYCVNGMLTMLCDEIVYVCLVISTWIRIEENDFFLRFYSVKLKKMEENKFL